MGNIRLSTEHRHGEDGDDDDYYDDGDYYDGDDNYHDDFDDYDYDIFHG